MLTKTEKIERNDSRKAIRGGLTARQQLKALDQRLGKGLGAKNERARLAKELSK